jgi:hypothetical protein
MSVTAHYLLNARLLHIFSAKSFLRPDGHSADQEIPRRSWKLKAHNHLLDYILIQMDVVHIS